MQGFCVSLALGFAMIHCLVKKNKSETETGSFLPNKEKNDSFENSYIWKRCPHSDPRQDTANIKDMCIDFHCGLVFMNIPSKKYDFRVKQEIKYK